MPCVFCDIIHEIAPSHVIYSDAKFLAILDKYPIAIGHTLVLPKKHYERVRDMSQEDFCSLYARVHALNAWITERLGAPGSHLSINDGAAANQLIPHLHVHIIPRSENDNAGFTARKLLQAEQMQEIHAKLQVKNLKLTC